jgi:pyruvate kinase
MSCPQAGLRRRRVSCTKGVRMSADATFRRTKIIFTLGPATESEEMLEQMIRAGADIVRLNMAHAKHDWTRLVIRRIRAVSKKVGREVAIMMDIKGPEIRTGDLEVLAKDEARIRCRVLIPGELKSRRHINLPGVKVNLPSFTEKDRKDSIVGLEEGIDFLALSFVRMALDIEGLRDFLNLHKSKVRIIAKIEDQSAITNLDEIVAACDGLMVARGDLGIECPFEELPVIQRRAVRACLAQGRAVIVATHMLESMITQPVPTRAEITDVANAVYELADCVMLSGETTIGKYPLECVQMLDKISRRIEAEEADSDNREQAVFTGDRMKVLHSAVVLANEIPRSILLTFTRHGFMAQGLAALRPVHAPVIAFTPSLEVLRQLRLLRGVEPYLMQLAAEPDLTIESAISVLRRENRIKPGDKLIVATDIVSQDRLVDSVQLRTIR